VWRRVNARITKHKISLLVPPSHPHLPALADDDGSSAVADFAAAPTAPAPMGVRYGWGDYPLCMLYNSEGLAASPFIRAGHGILPSLSANTP
jgi:hypothetical protein